MNSLFPACSTKIATAAIIRRHAEHYKELKNQEHFGGGDINKKIFWQSMVTKELL